MLSWRAVSSLAAGERLAWRTNVRCSRCWSVLPERRHSSVSIPQKDLTWDQMHFASKLARWSGLCYYPEKDLPGLVQAEGLELVASGRTPYTSWYIADGSVDHAAFHQTACSTWAHARRSAARQQREGHHAHSHAGGQASHAPHSHTAHANDNGSHMNGNAGHAHTHNSNADRPVSQANGSTGHETEEAPEVPVPEKRRYRFVFVRGVQWGAPDADLSAISTALMNFWPLPLGAPASPNGPASPPPLVSHGGVTQLATDLYKQLAPFLQLAPQPKRQASKPHSPDPQAPQSATLNQPSPVHPLASQPPPANSTAQPSPPPAPQLTPQAASQPQPANSQSPPTPPVTVTQPAATRTPPPEVCIAGHSLGGALGMLVLAQTVLAGLRPPTTVTCHTFGSPPVLAHRDGGGGHRVLKALGLSDSAVRSFVLEHDPVPRALLTADPAFNTLKSYGPVRQLLAARGWLGVQQQQLETVRRQLETVGDFISGFVGPIWGSPTVKQQQQQQQQQQVEQPLVVPMLSADRFVFENVGSVFLMRGGAELIPVNAAGDVDQLLRLAVVDFMSQPARAIQAWLDHHHNSYAHDLETAALAELKRKLRQARLQQQEQLPVRH